MLVRRPSDPGEPCPGEWTEPGATARPEPVTNPAEVAWFDADQAPERQKLAFDHREILQASVERLRGKAEYTPLPAFLVPEPVTLPQFQHAYEVVLGRRVDKSGLRTRMLAADFLGEAGIVDGGSRRPPMGYRLKDRSGPICFPRTFGRRDGTERRGRHEAGFRLYFCHLPTS